MQIDFHHGTTYVLARWAGFSKDEAEIIAYASQYVDDAVKSGMIHFDTGAKFERRSSAHKMGDPSNLVDDANRQAWVLFHFLPGNQGLPAEQGRDISFINKLVCCPDSHIAREMLAECITEKRRPYSLHRLGITAHVYADTWAHQGFVGIENDINRIDLNADDRAEEMESKGLGIWPLGHGMALCYPDHPWRNWQYQDHEGNNIQYSNAEKFIVAADNLLRFMRRYLCDDVDDTQNVDGLSSEQKDILLSKFQGYTSPEGVERHQAWIQDIANGDFLFSGENITYNAEDNTSWKAIALGTIEGWDADDTEYLFNESFFNSNWKLFHDALQAHAFYLLHELLPKYGICVA